MAPYAASFESLLPVLILTAATYVILKSSDLLIDLASSLGRKLGLKDYFIGSFIVGVGTSLPELFTSIAAVFSNVPQLVAPTIYGTIIANLAAGFGLGVLALYCFTSNNGRVRLLTLQAPLAGGALHFGAASGPKRFLGIPIAFAVGSVVLSGVFYLFGHFGIWHATSFLILYLVFFLWELKRSEADLLPSEYDSSQQRNTAEAAEPSPVASRRSWIGLPKTLGPIAGTVLAFLLFLYIAYDPWHEHLKVFGNNVVAERVFLTGLLIIIGFLIWVITPWAQQMTSTEAPASMEAVITMLPRAILIVFLAVTILVVYYTGIVIVESVEWTAQVLGIGDTILAASALAVGTSLPDIVVAMKVARQGRHMLLFGHILQSNTFDVLLAMGICGVLSPLTIGKSLITGYSFAAGLSILCSVLFTVAIVPVIWTRRITLLPGVLMMVAFFVFMGLLFA